MLFNFEHPYILEDNIVCLRPLELSDFNLLLPYSLNEPELWRFNLLGASGADNLEQYIKHALKQREDGKEYPFIVYDKRSGAYIGTTRYYDFRIPFNTLEIGYTWYGKAFQGTGINRNCKYLLLEFAFEQLGVARVGFRANNQNERSKRAMKSIGCKEEGLLRNYSLNAAGERIDVIALSILKEEWHDTVKKALNDKRIKQ
jgi:N-acetyltransferase